MRKRILLAMLMIAAIVLSTSCSLIVKDATVDAQTVIIEVAGKSITKAEVQSATQNTLSYQQYMYSMYGLSYDPTNAATISAAQDSAIEALIQAAVINQKITEGGFDVFTEEELAAIEESAKTTYQQNADYIQSLDFADTQLTGEELEQAVAQALTAYGYQDVDSLIASEKYTASQEKLKASVVQDVTVTAEELQTAYDENVASAKSSYESSLAQYGTDVSYGYTIYYHPAGYRYVKNILRKFSDEDTTAISDLTSQVSAKQTAIADNAASLAELAEDASADTAEQADDRAALTAAAATLEAELVELNTALADAKAKAVAAITPTVEEIVGKLAEGEDFDKLMADYGEDTGMQSEPAMTTGYLVCQGSTQWVSEFTEASMALARIGDVSAPFETQYGIHIVKYVSDLAEGAVPLAQVEETLTQELLSSKQDTRYQETLTQWVDTADAKVYLDRMAD